MNETLKAVNVIETEAFWGGNELLGGVTVETPHADFHAVFAAEQARKIAENIRLTGEFKAGDEWLNVTEAMIAQWEQCQEDEFYANCAMEY